MSYIEIKVVVVGGLYNAINNQTEMFSAQYGEFCGLVMI